jgi:ribosome maturation factor RimP
MQPAIQDIVRHVEQLAAPLVEGEGAEIWSIDLRPEAGQWVLRVMLDREGGVTLDDLTRVHRQLSDVLDAHDPVPWRYTLEVSSPGVNRPLVRPGHYRRFLGQRVRVRTKTAQSGRRVFVGLLCEVGEGAVAVHDHDVGMVHIPWEDIVKATTEPDFFVGAQKKKNA